MAATLALLVIPPLLLATVAGWPLAGTGLSGEYLRVSLRSLTLPPPLLAAAVVTAVWAAWAVFAILVLLDVAALARGRGAHLTPLRLLALTSLGATIAAPSTAFAATAPAIHHAPASAHDGQEEQESEASPAETDNAEAQPVRRTRILSGFDTNSADLTPLMRESLASTTDLLAAYTAPGAAITITGHTDPSGSADHNQELSQRRADAAAAYLGEQLGEDVEITASGHGSQVPRSDGDDLGASGERRVEITYTLAPPRPADPPTPEPEPDAVETPDAAPRGDADGAEPGETVHMPEGGLLAAAAATGLAAGFGLGRLPRSGRTTRTRRPATAEPAASNDDASALLDDPDDFDEVPADGPSAIPASSRDPNEKIPLVSDSGGVRLAETRDGEPVRVNALTGLALTGTHAAPMAGALIASAATDPAVHAITTTDLLDQIGLPTDFPLPRAAVCSTPRQALIRAEAHTLAAARAEADDDQWDDEQGWVLLLLPAPTGPVSEQAATLARTAHDTRVLVVAVGEWPHGRHVIADRLDELRVRTDDGPQRLTGLTVRALPPEQLTALLSAEPEPEPETGPAAGPEDAGGLEGPRSTHPAPAPGAAPSTGKQPVSTPPPDEPAPEPPPDSMDRSTVRLRLFTPRLGIDVAGAEITTGLRTTSRTLLTLLALRRDGIGSDEIADAIAPDATAAHAKGQRNSAVGNLRTLLRGATDRPDAPVLVHTAGRYHLDTALFTADVWDFDDALAAARAARGDDRLAHLKAAVESYGGLLLADAFEPWLEPERQQRRRAAADACVELANTADTAQALDWLEKARQIDEFNEPLYRQIMRTQADRGHPDAAKRTFDVLAERLASIDTAPAEATVRLLADLTAVSPLAKKPMQPRPPRRRNHP